MGTFGLSPTPVAQVIGQGIDYMLLAKLGEQQLINDFVSATQRYEAVMARYKEQQIAELTQKLDELILIARNKRNEMDKKKDAHFNAANEHDQAARLVAQHSTNFHSLKHDVENSRDLLTMAEKQERQRRLNNLRAAYDRAVSAESNAVTRVREAKFAWDTALAEAKAADVAARECEASLKRLTGVSDNKSSFRSNGF
jgi:hypothetical protein